MKNFFKVKLVKYNLYVFKVMFDFVYKFIIYSCIYEDDFMLVKFVNWVMKYII